jgi:predicted kinase
MNKVLTLVRGLPGSGKSTFAKYLEGEHIEADMFFVNKETGEYNFDPSKLKYAHKWCNDMVNYWMNTGSERIIVSNTFTQEWEMDAYYKLAEQYGYKVFSIIIENRHNGVNEHGCPDEKIKEMKDRFEIKL